MSQRLFVSVFLSLVWACSKDDESSIVITPHDTNLILATQSVVILETSFSLSDAPAELNDYGIVYGTSPSPTTSNASVKSHVEPGTDKPFKSPAMVYQDTLRELDPATTYYARCYVENKNGEIVYGSDLSFKTSDGHTWATVLMKGYPGDVSFGQSKVLVGSDIYIMGGIKYNPDVRNETVYKYSIEDDEWTKLTNYPGKRSGYLPTVVIGHNIYMVDYLNKETWEYDIDANWWTKKAAFTSEAADMLQAFTLNGKVYAGFNAEDPYTKEWWVFDPADATNGNDASGHPIGKWTQLPDSPGTGGALRTELFTYGGKGYAYVGNAESSVYEFNPADNSWATKTAFPGIAPAIGSSEGSEFSYVIGNKLYMGPGASIQPSGQNFWTYDLANDNWEQIDINAPTLGWAIAFAYDGNGYLMSDECALYRYYP